MERFSPARVRFWRIEQRLSREEPALEIRPQALIPGPFDLSCNPPALMLPRIVLDALGIVARVAFELTKELAPELLVYDRLVALMV
jgi:hypothetical protein